MQEWDRKAVQAAGWIEQKAMAKWIQQEIYGCMSDKRNVWQPKGWITKKEWDSRVNKRREFVRFQCVLLPQATSQALENTHEIREDTETHTQEMDRTNVFSSLAVACWVFPPMQSSDSANYLPRSENVSCIAQECKCVCSIPGLTKPVPVS